MKKYSLCQCFLPRRDPGEACRECGGYSGTVRGSSGDVVFVELQVRCRGQFFDQKDRLQKLAAIRKNPKAFPLDERGYPIVGKIKKCDCGEIHNEVVILSKDKIR